jgi:hypothetical protein
MFYLTTGLGTVEVLSFPKVGLYKLNPADTHSLKVPAFNP